MRQHALLRFASLISLTFVFTALAHAVAPQRTFVSAQHGNDANQTATPPCSVTLPCRQFNVAIGAVLAGGEVVALDSGGYDPVAISKAVTLAAPAGIHASITAETDGSRAITVSAASTDTVVLRGLTLRGLGGWSGIDVTSVGNLHVEGCVISGFTSTGINVDLMADGSHIFIKDTIARNNGSTGVFIQTITGIVRASIDNSRSERNGFYGFVASDNSRVTIKRSIATGISGGNGFVAASWNRGTTAELNCEQCVSSNNEVGFTASAFHGAPTIRVSHSTATNNSLYGFALGGLGAVFESLGNNFVDGNGTDISGTITVITAK